MTLQEMPDFDTKVKQEPLVLLERIEQLMHTPEKAKYPLLTTVEILCNFLRCKQGDKESLLDYLSRFKSERDVLYRILGKSSSMVLLRICLTGMEIPCQIMQKRN